MHPCFTRTVITRTSESYSRSVLSERQNGDLPRTHRSSVEDRRGLVDLDPGGYRAPARPGATGWTTVGSTAPHRPNEPALAATHTSRRRGVTVVADPTHKIPARGAGCRTLASALVEPGRITCLDQGIDAGCNREPHGRPGRSGARRVAPTAGGCRSDCRGTVRLSRVSCVCRIISGSDAVNWRERTVPSTHALTEVIRRRTGVALSAFEAPRRPRNADWPICCAARNTRTQSDMRSPADRIRRGALNQPSTQRECGEEVSRLSGVPESSYGPDTEPGPRAGLRGAAREAGAGDRALAADSQKSPSRPLQPRRWCYYSAMKVIYKITYPTGKIYIGQDVTDDRLRYYGSPSKRVLEQDTDREALRDFTIRKQILWESETAENSEVTEREKQFILQYRSNDPSIGYNLRPKFRPE